MAENNNNQNPPVLNRQVAYEERAGTTQVQAPLPPLEPTRTERRAEYDKLMRITRSELQPVTVIHAMITGKQAQLIAAWKELEKRDYLEYFLEYQEDLTYEFFSIEDDPSKINHSCIAYRRGRYMRVDRHTIYGNCPMCFKAKPLGQKCRCTEEPREVTKLYFVSQAEWDVSLNASEQYLSNNFEAVNPFILSEQLEYPVHIERDARVFQYAPGQYDWNYNGRSTVLTLRHLIQLYRDRVFTDPTTIHEDFEESLREISRCPEHVVRAEIDKAHTQILSEDQYQILISMRRQRDRFRS